jgi:hypothetical protein
MVQVVARDEDRRFVRGATSESHESRTKHTHSNERFLAGLARYLN